MAIFSVAIFIQLGNQEICVQYSKLKGLEEQMHVFFLHIDSRTEKMHHPCVLSMQSSGGHET